MLSIDGKFDNRKSIIRKQGLVDFCDSESDEIAKNLRKS